eukprot:8395710-Pyramimonas_sp.AAC.1
MQNTRQRSKREKLRAIALNRIVPRASRTANGEFRFFRMAARPGKGTPREDEFRRRVLHGGRMPPVRTRARRHQTDSATRRHLTWTKTPGRSNARS